MEDRTELEMLLDETFDVPDESAQGFSITDDDLANWALRKVKGRRAERDRIVSLAQREIERLQGIIDAEKIKCESETGYLLLKLGEYFGTVPHRKTKTTEKYKLLEGELVETKGKLEFSRDEDTVVAWLESNGMPKMVKVERSARWKDLKEMLIPTDGGIVLFGPTGEIVDGVTCAMGESKFDIK